MRLIDADALKEEVKTIFCPDGYKIMMLERIDNAPTVDMNTKLSVAYLKGRRQGQSEERQQGEWIKNTDTVFKNRFNCSICGKLIFEPKENNNFCPNCGAKMKGGAE